MEQKLEIKTQKTNTPTDVLNTFLAFKKEIRLGKMLEESNQRGNAIIRLHQEVGLKIEDIKNVISSKDSKEVEGFVLSLCSISQENKDKFVSVVKTQIENETQE